MVVQTILKKNMSLNINNSLVLYCPELSSKNSEVYHLTTLVLDHQYIYDILSN